MPTPFPYENYATDETFYGREKEIKTLQTYIENSTNVLLFSKRQMGKSTLVKHLLTEEKRTFAAMYINILDITSAEGFAGKLLKAAAAVPQGTIEKTIQALKLRLKRANVGAEFDPGTGKVKIKAMLEGLNFEEMFEDAFAIITSLTQKQKVVLAIDEFQQVAEITSHKIDAALREYLQNAQNLSVIFLGSKRHTLNSLFAYRAPLYGIATPIQLGAIEVESIHAYAQKHLTIGRDEVQYIHEIAKGETKFIQMVLSELYNSVPNEEIDIDRINAAVTTLLETKKEYYLALYDTLENINQKKAFKAVCKYKTSLYANEVLKGLSISKSSMQSALKQLYEKEFIDKEEETYFVPERAFELWGESVLSVE